MKKIKWSATKKFLNKSFFSDTFMDRMFNSSTKGWRYRCNVRPYEAVYNPRARRYGWKF